MHTNSAQLQALMAREMIRDRLALVARGEDRRDAALLTACFWPGARCDFGIFAGSFAEYLTWVVPGSSAIVITQHSLGQVLIELAGDTAQAETHVTAYHRIHMGEQERDMMIGGRYLDRLERRGEDWRIAERTMLYDWIQDTASSVDWRQGLMGIPFSGSHYAGRTADDHSVAFFADRRPRTYGQQNHGLD